MLVTSKRRRGCKIFLPWYVQARGTLERQTMKTVENSKEAPAGGCSASHAVRRKILLLLYILMLLYRVCLYMYSRSSRGGSTTIYQQQQSCKREIAVAALNKNCGTHAITNSRSELPGTAVNIGATRQQQRSAADRWCPNDW